MEKINAPTVNFVEPTEFAPRRNILNSTPRLAIVGSGKEAGVSSFVLGLLFELNQRGVSVATAKLNSSLVETTHYRRITKCLSHTIDPWLLNKSQMLSSLSRLSKNAKLMLLVGEGGLFDKRPAAFSGLSDADILKASQTPAILVLDAERTTENLAVFVLGCCNYNPGVKIIGIVANKVKSAEQNERIQTALNAVVSIKYLGGIPYKENSPDVFDGVNPSLITKKQLLDYQKRVRDYVNIDALLELSKVASPLPLDMLALEQQPNCCRIGVADDAAFHLVIQDNLHILRQNGAELKSFSPLSDTEIPDNCQALYFPSGQIKLYCRELCENKSMLDSIRTFTERGGLIYAEGDACAYFCQDLHLSDLGAKYQGLGIMPAAAISFMEKFDNDYFPLCSIRGVQNSFLVHNGGLLRGIRDGRWLIRPTASVPSCLELFDQAEVVDCRNNNKEVIAHNGGFCPTPNVILSLAQMHWGANPVVARNFVEKIKSSAPKMFAAANSQAVV